MPKFDQFAVALTSILPRDLAEAVVDAKMPGLDGGPANQDLAERLLQVSKSDWAEIHHQPRALAESGLWLLAGDLERSHSISQSIETASGSFWHGIMHRRECDFGNAKYWFRRVGQHPSFSVISEQSSGDYSDPIDFVDACERAQRRSGESLEICKNAQWIEWEALMLHSLSPKS
ncbi:MAG: hypothetical protein ACON5J_18690 [Rubripirellula sp.]